ncbi:MULTISPECIES: 4'-phosphopantetheinyl transferase family protein [unclassified Niallia]|uniref:4'-phosphopantetheinyl transferase family protein n=1 Tax=unclassified Niallia TaxID=2837522 RepID=UPI0030F6F043
MVQLYSVKIENYENNIEDILYLLSEERKKRILRLRQIPDRIRGVVAETLVRTLIIHRLNIDNNDITLCINNFGKPYLKEYPEFQFNISHSGDYVLCAISDRPVGIDIEEIKDIDLKIADRFFTNSEINYINQATNENRIKRFYSIWTAKESYIKFIGEGMSIPLNSFTIEIFDKAIKLYECNGQIITEPSCYFKSYNISEKYKTTLCSQSPYHSDVIHFKFSDLFEEFTKIAYK